MTMTAPQDNASCEGCNDPIVSIQIKHSTREALVKLKADTRTRLGRPISYDELLNTLLLLAMEAVDRMKEEGE